MMNLWEANIVYELLVRSLSTLLRRDVMWDGGGCRYLFTALKMQRFYFNFLKQTLNGEFLIDRVTSAWMTLSFEFCLSVFCW